MTPQSLQYYFRHLKDDLPAGIVVFLVALPLCLGVALASGAPLFAGLIAGMVGGLILAWLSGSQLSISGPAAGLTVIIYNAIETLGSFQGFLVAVVIAGIMQLIAGFLKAGIIGAFFPSSVIKGMLAAIGLILIIKQIPHATGYNENFEGPLAYKNEDVHEFFLPIFDAFSSISHGVILITTVALLILLIWERPWFKNQKFFKLIPGPLVAVIWGVLYNLAAERWAPDWAVSAIHIVNVPVSNDVSEFLNNFTFPDYSFWTNPQVYLIAATLAIIGSLETLLSLEAVDKLDPLKRTSPTNRELKAQGVGNIISGLIGGLPITAVIVRSASNIAAGGKTPLSCFIHGLCILLSVMFFAKYINYVPLGCLSAILLHIGFKLAKPKLFKEFYRKGLSQLLPFIITIIAILTTDLLIGMSIGMVVGLFFVIKANYRAAITLTQDKSFYILTFNKDAGFLNKYLLRKLLSHVKSNSTLTIDASKSQIIDPDIIETIDDFLITAPNHNISVEIYDLYGKENLKRHEEFIILKDHYDKSTSGSNLTLRNKIMGL
ncbi:SulP family inorganic anion transporter [Candidatus Nitrotoga arctica]|uniref:Sulfate permease, MFS superfamily n=1 Tax=Candidatus Nitrotoga arctica TaxID=453162 RepID=A0ABM8YZU3_9PROT|nr:SulP family inorganic anion transporter [Candidatus Nitrotoga arctica]CAG9933090.1 Sulfate permease, MFS superfamily [Candidatus Nitrotoga arctica]